MYTTIEPRLIALLNNDDSPEPFTTTPTLELPPLHDLNILKAGRPLLLEPDASKRNGKPTTDSQLNPKHSGLISSVNSDRHSHKRNGARHKSDNASLKDRALGSSSPQSLRKILGDDTDTSSAISSKKRNIGETNKEDFITLPQPPKKQKAAKQVVPPIISGLFEPPPQAALFPPIASSSFHDSHGRNSLNITTPKVDGLRPGLLPTTPEKPQQQGVTNKGHKRQQEIRPRKRWTEEETTNLILGVTKHGVGNWSDILADSSFWFNARKSSDLKDRWRTCCPAELLPSSVKHKRAQTAKDSRSQGKPTSSLMAENILIDDEDGFPAGLGGVDSPKSRKSRAHRKKIEDLVELGIQGPIQKSLRRERRPFSDEEDRAIIEGYAIYGPVWTRIQRDTRFNLQSRQPTDLRDRFRNKHRDKFLGDRLVQDNSLNSRVQQTSLSLGSEGRSNDNMLAGPSQSSSDLSSASYEMDGKDQGAKDRLGGAIAPIHQSMSNREGLSIQEIISPGENVPKAAPPQNSSFSFKDNFGPFSEQPTLETSDTLPFTQPFDWNQGISAPFSNTIGEMDISRLLLDEPWPELPNPSGKEKQSITDANRVVASSAEPLHNLPSFMTMLNDVDQIDDMNETSFE